MFPRPTKAILKTAAPAAAQFGTLLADEEIRGHWALYAHKLLTRLRIQHPVRDEVETELRRRGVALAVSEDELALTLLDAIKAKRPDCYHVIGTQTIIFQIWVLIALEATAPDEATKRALSDAVAKATPKTLELAHFPDNPITIERDPVTGKHSLTDVEQAEPKHYMQILSYFRSLQPAGPVGRPPGEAKPTKSGRRPVDPDEGLRVYQCTQDGLDTWQTARKLGYKIPSDPKARERLRGRLRYLNAIGARLYHKKSG